MPVTISDTQTIPAIVLDKIHIETWVLQQPATQQSKKKVVCIARKYGEDEAGVKHFGEPFEVSFDDLDANALMYAVNTEGKTQQEFVTSYVEEVANINSRKSNGELDVAKAMAMATYAMSIALEIGGKVSINQVQ